MTNRIDPIDWLPEKSHWAGLNEAPSGSRENDRGALWNVYGDSPFSQPPFKMSEMWLQVADEQHRRARLITQKLPKNVITHTILPSRCIAQTKYSAYLLGPSVVDCKIPRTLLAFKTVSFVSSVRNANNLCLYKRISRSIFSSRIKTVLITV